MLQHRDDLLSLGIEHDRRFTSSGVDVFFTIADAREWLRKHGADESVLDGLEEYDPEHEALDYAAEVEARLAAVE